MKKRSAIAIAAGTALALITALAAFSIGFGGAPSSASPEAAGSARRERQKPIVKTVKRTVTVHKDAKGGGEPRVVEISGGANGAGATVHPAVASSNDSDDADGGYGDDDGYDDGYGEQESEHGEHETEHDSQESSGGSGSEGEDD